MNCFKFLLCLMLVLLPLTASAYDPFEVKIRTTYPKSMTTVNQAVEYLIEPFEYKLVLNTRHTRGASKVAFMPISPLARTTRTMAVYDAIQALIGPDNTILVDHKNKLVSFKKGVTHD